MTDKQSPTPEDQREAEEWVKAESPWDEGPDFKLERDSCREAYLAGVLRERERKVGANTCVLEQMQEIAELEAQLSAAEKERDRLDNNYTSLFLGAAVMEQERDTLKAEVERLREGLREFLDFVEAGATPLTLLASMQRARALLAAGEKAGGENEG